MAVDLSLNIIDRLLESNFINQDSFTEFCNDISTLDNIWLNAPYVEAVENTEKRLNDKAKDIKNNTLQTTRKAAGVYKVATDIGGMVYSTEFNLVTSSLDLISKLCRFIIKAVVFIPNLIAKLISRLSQLPDTVKTKIRGDIQLYITVNDIGMVYNNSLLNNIDTFVGKLDLLSQGDTWGTFLRRRHAVKDDGKDVSVDDVKICKEMEAAYKAIQHIEFSKTIVAMNDQNVINTYFGNSPILQFSDLRGVTHKTSYYQALTQLAKDLKTISDKLNSSRERLTGKYDRTQLNQEFHRLSLSKQRIIRQSIEMTSKCTTVISNIVKYVMTDINTIKKSVDRIASAGRIDINAVEDIDNNSNDIDSMFDAAEKMTKEEEAEKKRLSKEEKKAEKEKRAERAGEYKAYSKIRSEMEAYRKKGYEVGKVTEDNKGFYAKRPKDKKWERISVLK